jgi:hypothetical protein
LLSAIETCKEYNNILLGYPIIVFTDHKNNTFNGLKASNSDLVLLTCWLLLLEEYGVTFEYLPGKKYVVADALSRLEIDSLKIQEEEVLTLLLTTASLYAQIIYLEKNNENLEEDNPFDYFRQLHGFHAIRRTYYTTLQATPCQLVFQTFNNIKPYF